MDLMTIGMLVGGLLFLIVGGELLVRGTSSLAAIAGISPLVIGLTVVAFGTSSPELAVSLQAGLSGNSDIAVGNVVGSNIFNVLFILGACALLAPLVVSTQLIRREVPILIGISLLFGALALDGRIGLLDGALLFAGIVGYTGYSIIASRRETAAAKAEYAAEYGEAQLAPKKTPAQIALQLGYVVGTSIIATLRKERDIAIGNVVGSNIFNILGILGISALVTPGGLEVAPSIVNFDLPVMIAVALACLPIFFTGFSIARWEGGLFLGYYVAYTAYLVLAATQHDALPAFSNAMLLAVLPLTAVTLVVLGAKAFVDNRRPRRGAGAAD